MQASLLPLQSRAELYMLQKAQAKNHVLCRDRSNAERNLSPLNIHDLSSLSSVGRSLWHLQCSDLDILSADSMCVLWAAQLTRCPAFPFSSNKILAAGSDNAHSKVT